MAESTNIDDENDGSKHKHDENGNYTESMIKVTIPIFNINKSNSIPIQNISNQIKLRM